MKVVGMLPVFNEKDMVGEVIEHLLSQELELVVLDNGSTDGSYEICKKYANKGKIKLQQFKTTTFNFTLILRILYDMALTLDPDWLIRSDQDEILESGINNVTLKKAIEDEDIKGNNLIQFDVFEFFRTNNDNENVDSIKRKFPYYSWQHDYAYRAWKHISGTRVEDVAGHRPIFPEGYRYSIAEQKFVLRHYRFRDKDQAIRNNTERIERTKNIPERKIGWYVHFDKISKQKYYEPLDHKSFFQYNEDNKWSYEKKLQPFVNTNHKRRDELFSKDGNLLEYSPTIPEMWALLKEKDEKINEILKEFDELKSSKNDNLFKFESNTENNYNSKNTKPFLIITGMHRSGTSFLARSLNLAGVHLGELESIITHDLKPHKDNFRGHWENTRLVLLGEKTLLTNNGSWKNIPDTIKINEEIGNEIKKEIKELTSHISLFTGYKDPRILLCLEVWKPYLPKDIMIIGIFRHPLKVAESLKKRNNFTYEKSLELWKIYNERLLSILEKYEGFLINFDWPKEKIISELNFIFHKLGLSDKVDLAEWYTEELIKSDKTFDSTFELPAIIDEIYSKLSSRSEKNIEVKLKPTEFSENDLKTIIDELLLDLQKQVKYFKKISDTLKFSQISDLESQISDLESQISNQESQISNLKSDLSSKESQIIELQKIIHDIHNSFTWRTFRKYDDIKNKLQNLPKNKNS